MVKQEVTDRPYLEWTEPDSSLGPLAYKIYRTSHGKVRMVGTTTSLTFSVAGLIQGQRSDFHVTASNIVGEGPPTSKVTVQRH